MSAVARLLTGGQTPIVCRTLKELSAVRRAADAIVLQQQGRLARVGFVPTMGALHSGHLSLIECAKQGKLNDPSTTFVAKPADLIFSSIFVNPTQFAPTEDLSTYPRTFETDMEALTARGCHVVFAPTAAEMYTPHSPFRSFVTLTGIDASSPEGAARPGFFRGVATVVTKLLNIVQPTDSYFGQKDGIQCIVVRTLARDLNLPGRIHIGSTVREADGLAMSSRNVYLSAAQRKAAPVIYRALEEARETIRQQGITIAGSRTESLSTANSPADAERAAQLAAQSNGGAASQAPGSALEPSKPLSPQLSAVAQRVREVIASEAEFSAVQYVSFSDGATGQPIADMRESTARHGAVLLSVAAKIGSTRLLDNIVLQGAPNDLGWPAGCPAYEL